MRVAEPKELVENLECLTFVAEARELVVTIWNSILKALVPILVVNVTQLFIRQNVISLANLVEFKHVGGELSARMTSGMNERCQFAEGLRNLFAVCLIINAEHFVIASWLLHLVLIN